ncbi:MAG: glutaredoxin family protein [Proteobacteria bacterium]|nr:glutaredoxin family protein [Pseudomonadota bacterium]MCH9004379.1 glutaredoxin family protein [Pseudomonadota bacterium]
MTTIQYYTRKGCHLCEEMLEELLPMIRSSAEIEIRDVDDRPEWRQKYDVRVPVIEHLGQVVSEYPLDYDAIRRVLAESHQNSE